MTRHDIPDAIKNLLHVAIQHDVLDACDVYALATEHGADWSTLVDYLCECAHAGRHCNSAAHSAIMGQAEVYWRIVHN